MARGYECPECGDIVPSERGLKTHIGRKHGKKSTAAQQAAGSRKSTRRAGPRSPGRAPAEPGVRSGVSELDEVREIVSRVERLSPAGRTYVLDLLERGA